MHACILTFIHVCRDKIAIHTRYYYWLNKILVHLDEQQTTEHQVRDDRRVAPGEPHSARLHDETTHSWLSGGPMPWRDAWRCHCHPSPSAGISSSSTPARGCPALWIPWSHSLIMSRVYLPSQNQSISCVQILNVMASFLQHLLFRNTRHAWTS